MSDGQLLDASALLALIFRETCYQRVADACPANISAATLSEVIAKRVDRGVPQTEAEVAHREAAATRAGLLRDSTRRLGLSLGDRCCLATAQSGNFAVLTADAAWEGLASELGITIINIRKDSNYGITVME